MTEINHLLRLLGIGANYSGQRITAAAVTLSIQEPERLLHVTKELYPLVAEQFGCTWQAVERSIRSSANRAWARNPQFLASLARYPMSQAPTASEFIDILFSYIVHNQIPTA